MLGRSCVRLRGCHCHPTFHDWRYSDHRVRDNLWLPSFHRRRRPFAGHRLTIDRTTLTSLDCETPWQTGVRPIRGHAHLGKKGKGQYSCSWKPHLRATGRHLPYGITQCYLPSDTSERAPPNPSEAGWYSIYLPRRDGRLSWPSWVDSAPAGSRTSDLSITSPTPNRCTTVIRILNGRFGLQY